MQRICNNGTVLCCAVLCRAVPCRAVLYCTVLYCTVLYCTVLYCAVLYCIVMYCTVLYCAVLYCTVLYCAVLYCTVCCTVLYCTYFILSTVCTYSTRLIAGVILIHTCACTHINTHINAVSALGPEAGSNPVRSHPHLLRVLINTDSIRIQRNHIRMWVEVSSSRIQRWAWYLSHDYCRRHTQT